MTIKELKEQRGKLVAELKSLQETLKKEDREFTDDERNRVTELRDQDADYKQQIEALEEQQKKDAELSAYITSTVQESTKSNGRRTQPDNPVQPQINVRDAFLDDTEKRGFKDHREFLMAVMDHAQKRIMDKRLKPLMAPSKEMAAGSDEAGFYSDPYGGFFMPKSFAPQVLRINPEADPTVGRTTSIPMTTPMVAINARVDKNHTSSVSGGLQVYRRKESQTVSATRMEHEQVELRANQLMGLAYATEELLQYSPISFIALLEAGFSDEFNAKLLREKISGTGTGEYEGVLNASSNGPLISVAKESGQAANTIVYENVIKMRARMWGYANAVWLANHDTLPQLMQMNQTIGTGGVPVWQPSAREDAPDMLLGRPLFFSEFAKTLGTEGDLICGNWSQYLEGTLSNGQSAESMHVRFVEHERTFKFWMENDGRTWWRSALTPAESSDTLSPFVVLATRA